MQDQLTTQSENSTQELPHYAGFWIRLCALSIDVALVPLVFAVVTVAMHTFTSSVALPESTIYVIGFFFAKFWHFFIVALLLCHTIVAAFFVWHYGATPGKLLFNLRITTAGHDRKMTLGKSIVREVVGKFISIIIFPISHIIAAFDKQKQSLHDQIADTIVIQKNVDRTQYISTIIILAALLSVGSFFFSTKIPPMADDLMRYGGYYPNDEWYEAYESAYDDAYELVEAGRENPALFDDAEEALLFAWDVLDTMDLKEEYYIDERIKVYNELITVYKWQNRDDDAIKMYETLATLHGEDTDGYYVAQAEIAYFRNDAEEAIKNFEKALAINPDNLNAHNGLGTIYMGDLGIRFIKPFEALHHNKKAYALNSQSYTIADNVIKNYIMLGQYEDALLLVKEERLRYPSDASMKYTEAKILQLMNVEPERAKALFREAIEKDPSLYYSDPSRQNVQLFLGYDVLAPQKDGDTRCAEGLCI